MVTASFCMLLILRQGMCAKTDSSSGLSILTQCSCRCCRAGKHSRPLGQACSTGSGSSWLAVPVWRTDRTVTESRPATQRLLHSSACLELPCRLRAQPRGSASPCDGPGTKPLSFTCRSAAALLRSDAGQLREGLGELLHVGDAEAFQQPAVAEILQHVQQLADSAHCENEVLQGQAPQDGRAGDVPHAELQGVQPNCAQEQLEDPGHQWPT